MPPSGRRWQPQDPERLATVATAIGAGCMVDALCLDCGHIGRLDLGALAAGAYAATPLTRLPLRCRCGSDHCRVLVSGRPYLY